MGKVQEGGIVCAALKAAYNRAHERAFNNLPGGPAGVNWDSEFGNQVTTKGTATGKSDCFTCGKHLSLTINFPKIKATDSNSGSAVKLYDAVGGGESISVSGHQCTEDENQK